jgi:hypothetical protein
LVSMPACPFLLCDSLQDSSFVSFALPYFLLFLCVALDIGLPAGRRLIRKKGLRPRHFLHARCQRWSENARYTRNHDGQSPTFRFAFATASWKAATASSLGS